MKVVAIASYKGGVGKTTLTANIGAAIARLGKRVLMIDLDPQANLTFSFYPAEVWRLELADQRRTVKAWFESWRPDTTPPPLAGYVTTPPTAAEVIAPGGGRLDLLASHLALGDVEMDLTARLGGAQAHRSTRHYFEVYERLATGLASFDAQPYGARPYDLVVIDCPPHFGVVTRAAIAACDHVLVPARPDLLSTLGVEHLLGKIGRFVWEYNRVGELQSGVHPAVKRLDPRVLGVVFMMVQYYRGRPTSFLRRHIDQITELGVPTFTSMIRSSHRSFAGTGDAYLPAVLSPDTPYDVACELVDLVEEFLRRLGASGLGEGGIGDWRGEI
ncbi:putative Chromosome partitioning protein parA [Frankia canadensis]|uniref:Putative Chromosome partitioning protein parA n=1 Tax=Frankia canadensis TaxID=1836972 RepID=A0A2I2KXP6_9ACTN|nr:ParA family protein [Frankia canadensis]SNQ50433.1 putative Chromosome partitioning protein parA [Frankia canadensis]SOU57723.1 putative Chromosome partitioning protein parA [Frankia canadensis]